MMRFFTSLLLLALLFVSSPGWAAVGASDDSGTHVNDAAAATSVNNNLLTVGTGANRFLLCALHSDTQTISSVNVTWDNLGTPQTMTLIGAWNSGGATGRVALYGLVAPHSGTLQSHADWVTSANAALGCKEFTGVDQTTPYIVADTVHSSGTTGSPSETVTSSTDGATVGVIADETASSIATNVGTEVYAANDQTPRYGMSYTLGGTSNTHSWTSGGTPSWVIAGVHIQAVQSGGGGSSHTLTLMGVGN